MYKWGNNMNDEFSRISTKRALTSKEISDKIDRLATVLESEDYLASPLDSHGMEKLTRFKAFGAIEGPVLNLRTGQAIKSEKLTGLYVGSTETLKEMLHYMFEGNQNVEKIMADIFHLKEINIRHPEFYDATAKLQSFVGPVQRAAPHIPS